ncbi:MAG: hypothetical protein V4631_06610 [Pseudomonadota bacterium]
MSKTPRPVPRKPTAAPVEDNDVLAQSLAELALDLSEREHAEEEDSAALHLKEDEFNKLVRNALRKKNDEALYGAIERARFTDVGAYQYARSHIEEAAATILLRKHGGPAMEVNAFALPLFVQSFGGLKEADGFQDGDAFVELVESFKKAGLESPGAKVVMISHAYDVDEAARISYSDLNEMARDAATAMTEKKLVATPALERSMVGWAPSGFEPGDKAVELRYLLGFALKRADDPFYQAPAGEAAADAYYEQRMARYRSWTAQAGPLVQRCLALDPDGLQVHFLYQDLFFGAREQGMEELSMLRVISELGGALEAIAGGAEAIVGPADVDDMMVLRISLTGPDGAPLGYSEKPLDLAADLASEVRDVHEALATLGVEKVSVTVRFGPDGLPHEMQPYPGTEAA